MPSEDDTIWKDASSFNGAFWGGMVGEMLTGAAEQGGFTWNAFVVLPLSASDTLYNMSWDLWILDWVNRVDIVAVWAYDRPERRGLGIAYPYPFYELSPVLVVADMNSNGGTQLQWWQYNYWAWLRPFTPSLWAICFLMAILMGTTLRHVEDDFEIPRESPIFAEIHRGVRGDGSNESGSGSGNGSGGAPLESGNGNRSDNGNGGPSNVVLMAPSPGRASPHPKPDLKRRLRRAVLWFSALITSGTWTTVPMRRRPDTMFGKVIETTWDKVSMLLASGYTANLASSLVAANTLLPDYTASSFDGLRTMGGTACVRPGTAIQSFVETLLPASRIHPVNGAGLAGQQAQGAIDIRSGICAGMVQPQWFAENMLISPANDRCDLRIMYPSIVANKGGWITATEWLRDQSLTNLTEVRLNMTSKSCAHYFNDAFAMLLKSLSLTTLSTLRLEQKERLRASTCNFDGTPLLGSTRSTRRMQLTIWDFGGIFFLLLVVCVLSILIPCLCRRYQSWTWHKGKRSFLLKEANLMRTAVEVDGATARGAAMRCSQPTLMEKDTERSPSVESRVATLEATSQRLSSDVAALRDEMRTQSERTHTMLTELLGHHRQP